jgi:hypothetical protein
MAHAHRPMHVTCRREMSPSATPNRPVVSHVLLPGACCSSAIPHDRASFPLVVSIDRYLQLQLIDTDQWAIAEHFCGGNHQPEPGAHASRRGGVALQFATTPSSFASLRRHASMVDGEGNVGRRGLPLLALLASLPSCTWPAHQTLTWEEDTLRCTQRNG